MSKTAGEVNVSLTNAFCGHLAPFSHFVLKSQRDAASPIEGNDLIWNP